MRTSVAPVLLAFAALACDPKPTTDPTADPAPIALRPQANPTEYTGITVERAISAAELRAVAGPFFGLGGHHTAYAFASGVLVSTRADTRTQDQVVLDVEMDVSSAAEPARRLVSSVPASAQYGEIFLDTCEAALANAAAVRADDPSDARPWQLEYRVRSAQGGHVVLTLVDDGTRTRLRLTAESPRTSLLAHRHNEPAYTGDPYETLYGLVYFQLSRDDFDFFSTRAYGITAGAGQNFKDFHLLPHRWLRLTVTPQLDDERVDVAFEVVTTDGRRIPVARAPASIAAGEQFMQNVFRMVDNMNAAEVAEPGSSMPWRAPFYYDDPESGGVVEVIAEGRDGVFQIAYAVETPVNLLRDTDFVPYQGTVDIPADWDAPKEPGCDEPSARGQFKLSFEASPTVRNSTSLTDPLKGPVWGSVYRAVDVEIDGPKPGTSAVADFHYPLVDLTNGPSEPFDLPEFLDAGEYQILGFMDIDANAVEGAADPDPGDPVMIPIGGFTLGCPIEPVTVEFAILMPRL
jgi:hypothetical protein